MITPPSEAVKIVKTFLDDDREQLIMYPSKIIQFQYKSWVIDKIYIHPVSSTPIKNARYLFCQLNPTNF